jgi:hypothetical protein
MNIFDEYKDANPDLLKKEIIQNLLCKLPEILIEMTCRMETDDEKGLFLISALGVLSGMIPNVAGTYGGQNIEANLFVYIYGDYGCGKAGMGYANMLGSEVDYKLICRYKENLKRYLIDRAKYDKELSLWKRNKATKAKPPTKPDEPVQEMLFIPANITKSGLHQILENNKGKGIIYESEGDTLVEALKSEHGGFSDLLRKAFHHEKARSYRKTEKEFVDLSDLALSILLSSTLDQMKKLIPSAENGLLSRIIFYKVNSTIDFHDPWSEAKNGHVEYFKDKSKYFSDKYFDHLSNPKKIFRLSEGQKKNFIKHFQFKKKQMMDDFDVKIQGTANRFGTIVFRLMMLLTVIRYDENNNNNNNILTCSDDDFDNALSLLKLVEPDILEVHRYLDRLSLNEERYILLHKEGKSYREIAKEVHGDERKYQTVNRFLKKQMIS